jgi:hypothetical protein
MCYDVSMSTSEPGRGKRPRSQRGAVEDRWRKRGKDEHGNTIEVPSKVTRWRARYVENAGKEHTRHFDRKVDAQNWLKEAMASIVRGDHVAPKVARLTVGEWSGKWLDGYRTRRKSTVRQAEVHLKLIKEHFGAVPMASVKPSDVRGWTAQLKAKGRADSYVYALHARLSQLFSDAVHDGIVPRNPCSLLRGGEDTSAKPCGRPRSLRRATPTAASVRVGYHSSLRAARSTSWPCSNRSSGLTRSTVGCAGPRLPKSRCSCPHSKRLIGPSCSGRLAEPVGRRKSC